MTRRVSVRAGDVSRLDREVRLLARRAVRERWTADVWHQERARIVNDPAWARATEHQRDLYIMYLVAVQHMMLDHLLEHKTDNHWYWRGTKERWV